MSDTLQQDQTQHFTFENEIWKLRWFLVRLNAIALLLSIPASVLVAILTKSPLPSIIPAPLTATQVLIIRWAFSQHSQEKQQAVPSKIRRIGSKKTVQVTVQPDVLSPSE